MTLPPTPLPDPSAPLRPPRPKTLPARLPSLWSQLEPARQQQLAQHWAELVRRLQVQLNQTEGPSHDQP